MPDDFLPCPARRAIVQFQRDGSKNTVQRCTSPTAPFMGQTVDAADCAACPVRDLVNQAFNERVKFNPPLVAEVATVRGCKPDANSPAPWVPCVDRNLVAIGSCCGNSKEIRVCDSPECFRLGSQVTPEQCQACQYRKTE